MNDSLATSENEKIWLNGNCRTWKSYELAFLFFLFYYNGYKTLLTFLRKYLPEKFQCFERPSLPDVNLCLIDSNNDPTFHQRSASG